MDFLTSLTILDILKIIIFLLFIAFFVTSGHSVGNKVGTILIWSVCIATGYMMGDMIEEYLPGFMDNFSFLGDEGKYFLIMAASSVPLLLGGSAVSYNYSDEILHAVVTTLLSFLPIVLLFIPVIKYVVVVVLFLLGMIPAFILRIIGALIQGYGFMVGLTGPYYSLDGLTTDIFMLGALVFSLLPGLIASFCSRTFGYTTIIGTIKDIGGNTIATIRKYDN